MKSRHKVMGIIALLALVVAILVSVQGLVFTDGSPAPIPVVAIVPVDQAVSIGGVAVAAVLTATETTNLVTIGSFFEQNGVMSASVLLLLGIGGISVLLWMRTGLQHFNIDTTFGRFSGGIDARRSLAGGDI